MGLLAEAARSKAEIPIRLGHKEVAGQLSRVIRLLLRESGAHFGKVERSPLATPARSSGDS